MEPSSCASLRRTGRSSVSSRLPLALRRVVLADFVARLFPGRLVGAVAQSSGMSLVNVSFGFSVAMMSTARSALRPPIKGSASIRNLSTSSCQLGRRWRPLHLVEVSRYLFSTPQMHGQRDRPLLRIKVAHAGVLHEHHARG